MGAFTLLNHLVNLFAPALWLALLMPLVSRVFRTKRPAGQTYLRQVAIYFAVGAAVLVAGLVVYGRDGKMLTYLALVLAAATCQWWLQPKGKA